MQAAHAAGWVWGMHEDLECYMHSSRAPLASRKYQPRRLLAACLLLQARIVFLAMTLTILSGRAFIYAAKWCQLVTWNVFCASTSFDLFCAVISWKQVPLLCSILPIQQPNVSLAIWLVFMQGAAANTSPVSSEEWCVHVLFSFSTSYGFCLWWTLTNNAWGQHNHLLCRTSLPPPQLQSQWCFTCWSSWS